MALDEVKLLKEKADGTFTEDLAGAKLPAAVTVPFDNTGTSLAAATVQAALVESEGRIVAAEGAIGTLQTSVADILSGSATAGNATLLNGNNSAYYLNRANHTGSQAADTVSYDNTISGLVATDVKAAIDEIAAMGGGGAQERVAVFDPDEASPSGNIYNDLGAALTALQAVESPRRLIVRKPGVAQSITIPVGTYNFAGVQVEHDVASLTIFPTLSFNDGSTISALPVISRGVNFRSNNTTAPLHTVTSVSFVELDSADFRNYGTTYPFVQVNNGAQFVGIIKGQNSSGFLAAGAPIINVTNGANAIVYVRESTNFRNMNDVFADDGTGGVINVFREELHTGGYAATNSGITSASFDVNNISEERVRQIAIENKGHNVFYFDPNLPPEANLFDDFDDLYAALLALPAANNKAIVYFNFGGAGYPVPTVQSYNFTNCIFKQWYAEGDVGGALQFPDGCTVEVFPIESEINFEFNNTVVPVSVVSGGNRKEATFSKTATVANYGSQPVFQTNDTGSIYEITLKDLCNWNIGTIFKNNAPGGSLNVNLFGGARVGNVFDSVALSSINIVDSTLISNSNAPSSYGAGSLSYTNEYESRVTQLANSIATPNWIKLKTGFEYNLMGDRSIANLIEVGPSAVFGYTTGGTLTARSVNNGVDWQNAANVSDTGFASVMTISSTHYVVRCSQSGNTSSYSTDVGATWNTGGTLPSSGSWLNTVATTVSGVPRIIATKGASTESAYTTDGGVTWTAGGALPSSGTWRLVSTVVSGTPTVVAVKESSNESAYSTDGGATWTAGGTLPASGLYALCSVTVSGTPRVVAVQSSSTASAYSTDGGATWIAGGTVNTNFLGATKSIIAKDDMVFAILGNGVSVVKSINGGVTWVDHGKLTNSQHTNLYIFQNAYGSYLYASGNVAGGTAMYLN